MSIINSIVKIEHYRVNMKNKKSIFFIVAISLIVGLLHVITGSNYQGMYRQFIRGYLIDILLPMNVYLLLQLALRKQVTVVRSRILGGLLTFLIGTSVEILQRVNIPLFGNTYDPLDLLMYGIGIGSGIMLDFTILNRLERQKIENGYVITRPGG